MIGALAIDFYRERELELAATVERVARLSLLPPPRLRLSTWIEREIRLPESVSSLPGRVRLYPYQREIADAISDPLIERVTLVKAVRVGFTTLLTSAIASFVANDPAQILCLQPTEDDCRDYVVSDLEPTFAVTPAVAGLLAKDAAADEASRNTLMHRRFPGGFLKVVAAKAPRNLRRHNVRVLLVDEADAMELTKEGDAILLAEKRTMAAIDRKIVIGSTPLVDETSHVLRAYGQSDQRVFELPCPSCAAFAELQWGHIEWEPGKPDTAAFRCPACHELIGERFKASMLAAGRWRATMPDVRGHAGFRLNALVSPLPNASWGKLAVEFLRAKEDSDELQVFTNTILAQGWREAAIEVDDATLAARAEPFSLEAIPVDVLVLTMGTDVQDDRLETTTLGFQLPSDTGSVTGRDVFVLDHRTFWGSPDDEEVWAEHEAFRQSTFAHPLGGRIGIDACLVDSGDGERTDKVYAYTFPRASKHVFSCKGIAGNRDVVTRSRHKVGSSRVGRYGWLMLVGVDVLKTAIYDRLSRGRGIRFSNTMDGAYFEQVASERKITRYVRGQPVRRFERKPGAKAEGLDCMVYAMAARYVAGVDMRERAAALTTTTSDGHAEHNATSTPVGRRFTNSYMGRGL